MLSKIDKTRFCIAFFIFSFAWMLALQIIAAVLLPQRLAEGAFQQGYAQAEG